MILHIRSLPLSTFYFNLPFSRVGISSVRQTHEIRIARLDARSVRGRGGPRIPCYCSGGTRDLRETASKAAPIDGTRVVLHPRHDLARDQGGSHQLATAVRTRETTGHGEGDLSHRDGCEGGRLLDLIGVDGHARCATIFHGRTRREGGRP